MQILNFGSLNLDFVYALDHIVLPGETISSSSMETFAGGKGLNQSIALARAGAQVVHAGMVGADGEILVELLRENGVEVGNIQLVEGRTGHAIIQLDTSGKNSIVLFGGANRMLSCDYIDQVLDLFGSDTLVLMQNETNLVDYIIDKAYDKGMKIALNLSPYDQALKACCLDKVSVFLMNEVEGEQVTGESEPNRILEIMQKRYPCAMAVLTLGKEGAMVCCDGEVYRHKSYSVPTVDTTAAGDTFTGFFLASLMENGMPEQALHTASKAASMAVTIKGAANSIPWRDQVEKELETESK